MSSSTPTLSNSVVLLNGTQPEMPAAPRTESDPPTNLPGDTQTAGKEGNPENVNDATPKWPGWPGYCVFRIIVPVLKVGSIIGRKGELIKKTCEETRAKIRVLDGAVGTPDRIVLVSGKEEVEAPLSPAMDAVMRIFKRVTGLPETDDRNIASGAEAVAFCSVRLLVASTQAINLIGKQGSSIKSIQENSNASVRVLSENEVPFYASSDERIVELQGEALKVLKALEAVLGHLRKFLVDQSVLPLFEKNYGTAPTQDSAAETWKDNSLLHTVAQTRIHADFPLLAKRDTFFLDRESQLEPQLSSGLSHYGQDTSVSGLRSSMLGHSRAPILISQTMQIPLSYAEDIIGIGGANIAYIRRTSGAILTVQESRGIPEEIMVEIKGTSSQVQTAQQLIQEFISSHKEPSYGKLENGLRSSLSQLSTYTPSSSSSLPTQPYGGYGSSGVGGYSSLRL